MSRETRAGSRRSDAVCKASLNLFVPGCGSLLRLRGRGQDARATAGETPTRRLQWRILLQVESFPDVGDDLFGGFGDFNGDGVFRLFQVRQLAGQDRFAGEVAVTGA